MSAELRVIRFSPPPGSAREIHELALVIPDSGKVLDTVIFVDREVTCAPALLVKAYHLDVPNLMKAHVRDAVSKGLAPLSTKLSGEYDDVRDASPTLRHSACHTVALIERRFVCRTALHQPRLGGPHRRRDHQGEGAVAASGGQQADRPGRGLQGAHFLQGELLSVSRHEVAAGVRQL